MEPSVEQFIQDRRTARRFALKTPLRIRGWKSGGAEQPGESVNISESGMYLVGEWVFREGESIEVLFEMPREVTGEPPSEWRCTGHVVRVVASAERAGMPRRSTEAAVRFDCYEVARSRDAEQPLHARTRMQEMALGEQ